MQIITDILIFVLINALVWGLFFWQRGRLIKKTKTKVEQSGGTWVIPPEKAFVQWMLRGIISVKTMGAMGLTTNKLIFIPPLGSNKEYLLSDVVEVSENTWFAGNYRSGNAFMIVKLADGNEVGFQVSNYQRWMTEIKARIPST